MRAAWTLIVVPAALIAGTAGCGRSGYQYVQNEDMGIYARLPDDWTVYDETDLFPEATERELDQSRDFAWIRTFDAASAPSVEQSQVPGGDTPTGALTIRALRPQERDALNLRALRGGGNPAIDPVALEAAGGEGGGATVKVVLNETVEFEGDFSGIHTVFTMRQGDRTVVVDRTAVRDTATTAIAVFQVACSDTCYFETHKDEIADLVDSWTIQEVR